MKATALFFVSLCGAYAAEVNVTDFGAKGDGRTVNTQFIQSAIDAAAKTSSTVVFKPGVYLTGALFLKSGVSFRIDQGVTVRGVQDLAAYPKCPRASPVSR